MSGPIRGQQFGRRGFRAPSTIPIVGETPPAILIDHTVRYDLLLRALAISVVFVLIGAGAFQYFFSLARRRGQLLQQGE